MTREEAIQCIKHELLITVNRKDLIGQAVGEALDMAITALQGGDAEVRNDRTYINEPYMQQSRHDDGRMTREDAILILGEFKEFCDRILWNSIYAERSRAIDMAIEALQAEPSGDLISREEAIEAVYRKYPYNAEQNKCDEMVDALKALPSAELTLQTPQTYGKSINPSNAEVVEDYISRTDAIEAVRKCKVQDIRFGNVTSNMILVQRAEVIVALSALPSADAVDVNDVTIHYKPYPSADRPRGTWEHWGSPFSEDDIINTMVCTNCGMRFVEIKGETFYYCPHCGVKMENTK